MVHLFQTTSVSLNVRWGKHLNVVDLEMTSKVDITNYIHFILITNYITKKTH